MSASSTSSPKSGPVTAGMLMGEPGKIAVIDSRSGEMRDLIEAPETGGGWGSCTGADGSVYFGTYPNGLLYRYSPSAGKVEKVGRAGADTTFLWTLAPTPEGPIYLGCYPKARLSVYDPKDNSIRELGTVAEGEDYLRGIAYDPIRKKVYCGIGSHAALIEYDPATGEKRNVLPEKYRSNHFTYTIGLAGKYLLAKMDPLDKVVVFDTETWKDVNVLPAMSSNGISSVEPDGTATYYTSGGGLMRFDTATNKLTTATAKAVGAGRGFAWLTGPDGHAKLQVTMLDGTRLIYDPATGDAERQEAKIPQQPVRLHNIIAGPDGKIYTSGYVVGLLGVFDPETKQNIQIGGVKQSEGMTAYESRLYFGTYPRAIISMLDTARKVSRSNPKVIFNLSAEEQDRPFAMLGVPEEKKVFVGTVPGYGLLGGALATYDTETQKHKVFRDVIPKQSLIGFAYKDSLLYAGTAIWGGLGIEPVEKESKLFIWDIKQEKKVFETTPVPGSRGISGLQFASDGNLWGWGEGTLFIFDPKERKIIFSKEQTRHESPFRHFWRGGYMTDGGDGFFYGNIFGQVYKLDQKTREMTIIAEGKEIELIARDKTGRLYFVDAEKLHRLTPKAGH